MREQKQLQKNKKRAIQKRGSGRYKNRPGKFAIGSIVSVLLGICLLMAMQVVFAGEEDEVVTADSVQTNDLPSEVIAENAVVDIRVQMQDPDIQEEDTYHMFLQIKNAHTGIAAVYYDLLLDGEEWTYQVPLMVQEEPMTCAAEVDDFRMAVCEDPALWQQETNLEGIPVSITREITVIAKESILAQLAFMDTVGNYYSYQKEFVLVSEADDEADLEVLEETMTPEDDEVLSAEDFDKNRSEEAVEPAVETDTPDETEDQVPIEELPEEEPLKETEERIVEKESPEEMTDSEPEPESETDPETREESSESAEAETPQEPVESVSESETTEDLTEPVEGEIREEEEQQISEEEMPKELTEEIPEEAEERVPEEVLKETEERIEEKESPEEMSEAEPEPESETDPETREESSESAEAETPQEPVESVSGSETTEDSTEPVEGEIREEEGQQISGEEMSEESPGEFPEEEMSEESEQQIPTDEILRELDAPVNPVQPQSQSSYSTERIYRSGGVGSEQRSGQPAGYTPVITGIPARTRDVQISTQDQETVSTEAPEPESKKEEEPLTRMKSVNTQGSAYDLSRIEGINGQYLRQGSEIVILEINQDYLKEDSVLVKIIRDMENMTLVKDMDYSFRLVGDSAERKVYQYTIFADVFGEDGTYQVFLSSEDQAGNVSSTESRDINISFIVDHISPLILSGMEYKGQMEQRIREIRVRDDIPLAEVAIYLGDTPVSYEVEGENYRFRLPEGNEETDVKVIATDRAGNTYERILKNYVTAAKPQLRKNPIGALLAVLLSAAGMITAVLIIRRRKKQNQRRI